MVNRSAFERGPMLALGDLAPLFDLALTPRGLRDPERVFLVLSTHGWTVHPATLDGDIEEHHWRLQQVPGDTALGASAWSTSSRGIGLGLGLIVEASSLTAAHLLHDAIRTRILADGRFAPLESDAVWSNWSDGDDTVSLGVLGGSTEAGKNIPPIVQVSFEVVYRPV